MNLTDLSGIGRAIDPRYPSNLFVLAVSILAGAGTLTWRLATGAGDPVAWAVRAGLATFLGWAIARELDPDDTRSAGIAGPIAGLVVLLGQPNLAAAAALLLATRITVKTTGRSPLGVDLVVLILLAGYLGMKAPSWPAALGLIAAVAIDRLLPPYDRRVPAWAAPAMLVAAAVTAIAAGADLSWTTLRPWAAVVAAVSVAAGLSLLRADEPTSTSDLTAERLTKKRLVAGRLIAVVVLAGSVAWSGETGVTGLGPVAASLIGAAAVALATKRPFRVTSQRGG